jgi:hypothetical protein
LAAPRPPSEPAPTRLQPAPSARAAVTEDEVEPVVRVVIDAMAPAIPEDGDTLRLRGRVISTARTTLTGVSVQLRRASAPLPSRRDVVAAFDAGLAPADGEPADVPLPGTRTLVADELPPGARRPFTLRVPVDSLGLTAPGAYVIGVDVYAREAGAADEARMGVLRTFLPWFPPDTEVTPVRLAWLWPLVDWPARATDGTLLTDQTPIELSPDGRLDRLLDIGQRFRSTVSWIADPALLQTAAAMSGGYQVRQDGIVTVGDREQQARRWLDDLARTTRGVGLRTLPYADIDASAVTRGGLSNDVVRAVTQGPGIAAAALGRPVQGDLYWAPFGRIDRPALNVLSSAGVTDIVLSAAAMPATDEATPTDGLATASLPTSVGTVRAVLTDPGLTAILDLPQRSSSDVIVARQRFLAETAVLAQTLPSDQREVVDRPELGALERAGIPALPAAAGHPLRPLAGGAHPLPAAGRAGPVREPSTRRVRRPGTRGGAGPALRRAHRPHRGRRRGVLLRDRRPHRVIQPFAEALLRAGSSAWRSEPAVGDRLLTSIDAAITEETARVRVLSEGAITFSGDVGKVPITITNELDRSVTVGVVLRGQPALRLSSEPLTGIRIEPGRFASVDIDARVVGGDPLAVDVQLLSPDGRTTAGRRGSRCPRRPTRERPPGSSRQRSSRSRSSSSSAWPGASARPTWPAASPGRSDDAMTERPSEESQAAAQEQAGDLASSPPSAAGRTQARNSAVMAAGTVTSRVTGSPATSR